MKSMMQSVKRKLKTEASRESWEAKTLENHISRPNISQSRMSRAVSRSVIVHNLPSLRECPAASRSRVMVRKLRLCSLVFTFDDTPDTAQEARDKEAKRSALLELVNFLTVFKPSFTEMELEEIFSMLEFNLFRPLPPSTLEATGMYHPDEDEPQSESTWPHLQVVYEFLLRLATSTETDSKLMDRFFNREFVLRLLDLFDSEDPRERDYLKTILHRIYGNFMSLRPFIRRAINNVFYRFIYDTDRHNGIAELLEILGSIINGFALPLKEQHKQFLQKVLLPLHKVSFVGTFHPQLSYCVTQFLEKDASLAPRVVGAILKFWPVISSKKELMFLNEIEEVLDRIQSHHLGNTRLPLFRQIGKSICSPHFQVSERAIYVLNNDVIARFVQNNCDALIPLLSKALFANTFNTSPPSELKRRQIKESKSYTTDYKGHFRRPLQRWEELGHWNPTIVELTQDILKVFHEINSDLVRRSDQQHSISCRNYLDQSARRRDRWEQLSRKAQR